MLLPRCPSVCPLAISLPLYNSWSPWRISKKPDTNSWIQGHGLAVYSKSSFTFGPCIETRNVEATVFSVQQRPDVVIVSSKALLDLLQQIQTKYVKSTKAVLLGDFNIDWTSESFEKHALEKLMTHKLHYRQAIIGPPTDYNTTIDLIFTNIQTYKCGIMEALLHRSQVVMDWLVIRYPSRQHFYWKYMYNSFDFVTVSR